MKMEDYRDNVYSLLRELQATSESEINLTPHINSLIEDNNLGRFKDKIKPYLIDHDILVPGMAPGLLVWNEKKTAGFGLALKLIEDLNLENKKKKEYKEIEKQENTKHLVKSIDPREVVQVNIITNFMKYIFDELKDPRFIKIRTMAKDWGIGSYQVFCLVVFKLKIIKKIKTESNLTVLEWNKNYIANTGLAQTIYNEIKFYHKSRQGDKPIKKNDINPDENSLNDQYIEDLNNLAMQDPGIIENKEIKLLFDYSNDELINELKRRGFKGSIYLKVDVIL